MKRPPWTAQPAEPPEPATAEEPAEEEEPELTAAQVEILNALQPTCDDPWTEGFLLLNFPQPDKEVAFSDSFGADRPDNRQHRGIDIFSDKGQSVVAIADGVVTRISIGTNAGYYIVIEHEDGWESRYLHLNNDSPDTDDGLVPLADAVAEGVEVGAEVVSGQPISWVGDSGNAEGTPSHTHFEMLQDGHVANPYACLTAAFDRQLRLWDLEGKVL